MSAEYLDSALDNVMLAMAEVQRKSQAFMEMITCGESLSTNQLMLLFQLRLAGSLNITDISERFVVTPGAASAMSDKLENAGLIERIRTKEDRRVVRIALTAEGEQRILKLFDRFSGDELTRMANHLQQIHELMNQIVR
ncbi:MarR family winged helix-turn-helix transcriptional regulator [Paenibacillus tengchongensis]|uniref:MarR family winged helix-turn-helix transcriptional regulator n=1 Tax=Paenibacillus tengchongensis TaxID=2608684 RepID=UPI00124F09A6|nr:MarR family transcriptional regulator [Paenibacillus tengchongensis]